MGLLYKDSFQHSSWLAMMANRLGSRVQHFQNSGAIFISIDDPKSLTNLYDDANVFADENLVAEFRCERDNPAGRTANWFRHFCHEYAVFDAVATICRNTNAPVMKKRYGSSTENDASGLVGVNLRSMTAEDVVYPIIVEVLPIFEFDEMRPERSNASRR